MKAKYLPPKCKFEIEGKHIKTDGSDIHKVSGTSLGGIFGVSPWSSPFQVACALLGLGREDISDKPAVKAGIALEGRVIRYLDETYGSQYGSFIPAEEAYVKREGDHDSWVSDFDDDIYAGHVDGLVINDDGAYILEIKTSANTDSWSDGVPEYYRLQIMLYNHFIAKKDKAYVGLGITDEYTLKNPNVWVPNANTATMYEMSIDQEAFARKLEMVSEWYQRYILNHVTPDYDPANPKDVELYEHLVSLCMDIEDAEELVREYGAVSKDIEDAEQSIKAKYDRREELKEEIKSYMEAKGLSSLESSDGACTVSVSSSSRSKWNEAQMIADGIDTDKYKTNTEVRSIRMKYME